MMFAFIRKSERNHGAYSSALVALLIFLIAASLRIAFVFLFDADISETSDAKYYLKIAHSVIDGNGYKEGNLLAYRPPLFPLFIVASNYVFGPHLEAIRILIAITGALACTLVFFLGLALGGFRVGALAGLMASVYPPLIYYSAQIMSEALFIMLALFGVLCVVLSEDRESPVWRLAAGVILGLATLTREVGLLLVFGTMVWYMREPRTITLGLKRWSVVLIFAIATIAPWTIRNYLAFGAIVPVTTNSGINFYMGNNETATGAFQWAIPPNATWNEPSLMGKYEVEANRLGIKAGLDFIAKEPGTFLRLTLRRIALMIVPPIHNLDNSIPKKELIYRLAWLSMYVVILCCALVIAPVLLHRQLRRLSVVYVSILGLLLPHFFTVANFRYQLPIMPFAIVLAAMVLCSLPPIRPNRETPNFRSRRTFNS